MSTSAEGTALAVPTNDAVENIRRVGALQAYRKKELSNLYEELEGLSWGSGKMIVTGSSLSNHTRWALAEFCRVTLANPLTHLDIMGGKPYLNDTYWSDKLNANPLFHHYEQWDISPSVEEKLRELGMEDKANEVAMARLRWSPRENATVIVETTIFRFINAAPMEKIQSGEIKGDDLKAYIVPVKECNWAGGMGQMYANERPAKFDPIGDRYPGPTARSRSHRRCAVKAFSAWLAPFETQIAKAEAIIEAEFTIIGEDTPYPPPQDGPTMASLDRGQPLPEEGEEPEPVEAEPIEQPAQQEEVDTFDAKDALKRFFATYRDAGFKEPERKAWNVENGLPESTKEWGRDEFEKAQDCLMSPCMDAVMEELGGDEDALADLCLRVLEKDTPEYLKDWNALRAALDAREGGGAQPEMDL